MPHQKRRNGHQNATHGTPVKGLALIFENLIARLRADREEAQYMVQQMQIRQSAARRRAEERLQRLYAEDQQARSSVAKGSVRQ